MVQSQKSKVEGRRSKDPSGLRDASRGVRLHKAMADLGVGSRRACEAMIAEGRVRVNGRVVTTMPAWADVQRDRIEVDGKPVTRPTTGGHTYLLVHKPRHVICTNIDPQGRKKITDLVPHRQRLFCVGRLDAESTGLVLLTDDGDLANHLTHPRYGIPKTYEVSVRGEMNAKDVERLNRGMGQADKTAQAPRVAEAVPARRVAGAIPARRDAYPSSEQVAVRIIGGDRERTRLHITLSEGRNREIRPMLMRLRLNVRRLSRIALGPLRLKGVAVGQWRPLKREEVSDLRKAARRAEKITSEAKPVLP